MRNISQPAIEAIVYTRFCRISVELKEVATKEFFDFQSLPAQERVFHILSSRIIMANKCDKSPANRNTFILCFCWIKLEIKAMKYFFTKSQFRRILRGS